MSSDSKCPAVPPSKCPAVPPRSTSILFIGNSLGTERRSQVLLAGIYHDSHGLHHEPGRFRVSQHGEVFSSTLDGGCWMGSRTDGLYAALRADPDIPRQDSEAILGLLSDYLHSASSPGEWLEKTLQLEALMISSPFTLLLGRAGGVTLLVYVMDGAVQHCQNLGSGSFILGPAEDDQIGKRLDYITYQWHSGVCSDDTIIQHVLRALHSHADTQPPTQPFAHKAQYLGVMLVRPREVTCTERFFNLSARQLEWADRGETMLVSHELSGGREPLHLALPHLVEGTDGAPAVVVLPQCEHRKVDMDIAKLEQQKGEVAQQHKAKKARKGKGVPKDPNRPKNYMSAFNLWSKDFRPKFMQDNPGLKNNEVNKAIGELWKQLSQDEKADYDKLAEKDKLRYRKEVKEYIPSEGFLKKAARINSPGCEMEDAETQSLKGEDAKDEDNIVRPRTAYNFFTSQETRRIRESHDSHCTPNMSKFFSIRWVAMPDAERQLYHQLAAADEIRYDQAVRALKSG